MVEGHSSDLDHANRGGKFAKGQFGEEKSEFAVMVMVAIRENRKFNLRVSPQEFSRSFKHPPFLVDWIEIRMSSTRWGALVGNGFWDFNRLGIPYASFEASVDSTS